LQFIYGLILGRATYLLQAAYAAYKIQWPGIVPVASWHLCSILRPNACRLMMQHVQAWWPWNVPVASCLISTLRLNGCNLLMQHI